MAESSKIKGSEDELYTFNNWGKKDVIRHKTVEENGKKWLILFYAKFVQDTRLKFKQS